MTIVMGLRKVMKYRSRAEIIYAMLRSIRSGATKTRIMYGASLSFAQLKEYSKVLEERELMVYVEELRLYLVTERAVRFMKAYEEINELISSTQQDSIIERIDTFPHLSFKKVETFNY
jgi:predicted transcriptional regulator